MQLLNSYLKYLLSPFLNVFRSTLICGNLLDIPQRLMFSWSAVFWGFFPDYFAVVCLYKVFVFNDVILGLNDSKLAGFNDPILGFNDSIFSADSMIQS